MSIAPAADWDDHRAFLAVIETGSLSAAARTLGLAQPTVRRRIEALEAAIGAPLFTRIQNGLLPTERAHLLADHARAMALAADAFARAASADARAVAGTVRISASDVVAIEVLPPILAPLLAAHPALAIALSPTNRSEDVLRREADIAIRMTPPRQEALVAQRVGTIVLGLHAHPAYLAAHGTPATLAEMRSHRLIGIETGHAMLRAVQARGLPLTPADFGYRSDSDLAQLAAIRAGIGIGICQVPIARAEGLVRVAPDAFSFDLETWVVCHQDMRGIARIRAVFDTLVAGLRGYIRG